MNAYDEILFDGSPEQIENVRCPNCDGEIEYELDEEYRTFTVRCLVCHTWSKGCKVSHKPNCANFFGSKNILRKQVTE